ncbi:MAG TPA: glycosyltransferase family 2 protein [Rhizomicrobium sp.]|nr:glycosyltransferase family 2 protein [Rhizomicrobium sp.]
MSDEARDRENAGDIEVSVIVVTHGAREMTLGCLTSLAAAADEIRNEVIVVDNASRGALAAEIASAYPDFRVLPQVANLGFAAAANLGADSARGRYLLFLNPDTVVGRDIVVRLVEFAGRNPNAGPVGARTVFANGEPNPTCCRRKPTVWRLLCSGLGLETRFPHSRVLGGMGYVRLPNTGAFAADILSGVCLLVQRSLWDRLGGFSPAFFMYGEDDDLSLRARRIGYTPTLALDAAIVHHGSGTETDQIRKLCQILAARSLIVRSTFARPARRIGQALLVLRPLLGSHFAKRELRPFWRAVWAKRSNWLSGRFA